jgi:hypothetical protein
LVWFSRPRAVARGQAIGESPETAPEKIKYSAILPNISPFAEYNFPNQGHDNHLFIIMLKGNIPGGQDFRKWPPVFG